jgi:hypothetical protein
VPWLHVTSDSNILILYGVLSGYTVVPLLCRLGHSINRKSLERGTFYIRSRVRKQHPVMNDFLTKLTGAVDFCLKHDITYLYAVSLITVLYMKCSQYDRATLNVED